MAAANGLQDIDGSPFGFETVHQQNEIALPRQNFTLREDVRRRTGMPLALASVLIGTAALAFLLIHCFKAIASNEVPENHIYAGRMLSEGADDACNVRVRIEVCSVAAREICLTHSSLTSLVHDNSGSGIYRGEQRSFRSFQD